ncbi:MAG: hypothetical protein J6P73_05145 [Bacteroidales bacterium]|nr:hypothetical protein [Bacteroidales bacterium]
MKKTFFIALFAVLVMVACQKKVEYPIEPQITYKGLAFVIDADSTLTGEVVLSIGYTDGDGDLGLDDSDTIYPFGINDPHYYNLIIDYLRWDGTQFVADTINFNARFKRLVFYDEVKAISGVIKNTTMLLNPFAPNDTVKLRAHIIDRALHESNTIETEPICFFRSQKTEVRSKNK